MINIVFISYQFPPENVGGAQRPFKFVKYLREFGINPIVVKLSPESFEEVYENFMFDDSFMNELPLETTIIDVSSKKLINKSDGKLQSFLKFFFRITDPRANGWKPYFLPAIDKIINEYSPKAIFVTVPPFSVTPLAKQVSQKHKLPFIIDMRDAWSGWGMSPEKSYIHHLLKRRLEQKVLKAASKIIVTSDQTLSDLQKMYSTLDKKNMHLITNGYDKEIDQWILPQININEKFTIGYVGSFYYIPKARKLMFSPWWKKPLHHMVQYSPRKEDWLYRSPEFFFRSIAKLFELEPKIKDRLAIEFAGVVPPWLPGMISKYNLNDNVTLLGSLSLQKSLQFQASCDALLITSSKVIDGDDYSIAGKTFEYLSMQKPIIAYVPEGAQKRLLKKTGLALICNPDDSKASALLIKDLLANKIKFNPNLNFLKSLHRQELTKKLSEVILEAINDQNSA